MTSLNNQLSMNYEVLQSVIQMQKFKNWTSSEISTGRLFSNGPPVLEYAQEGNLQEYSPGFGWGGVHFITWFYPSIPISFCFPADLVKKHRNTFNV